MWSGCTFSWTMRESLFIFFVCSAWLVRYFSFGIFLPYSLKMHPNSWKASKKNRDMWFMTKNLKAFWYHTTGLAKHTKFPHSVSWSLEERKKKSWKSKICFFRDNIASWLLSILLLAPIIKPFWSLIFLIKICNILLRPLKCPWNSF